MEKSSKKKKHKKAKKAKKDKKTKKSKKSKKSKKKVEVTLPLCVDCCLAKWVVLLKQPACRALSRRRKRVKRKRPRKRSCRKRLACCSVYEADTH